MKAAFFDVDGTLTKHRVWSGVLDYFRENKVRLMRFYMFTWFHFFMYLFHKAGLVSQVKFRGAWAKNLSWHFAGFTLDQASDVWDWVIEYRIHDQWRANIVDVLHQHKDQGVVIFLVSGAPEGLLERISREVGGDYVVGTKHQVVNGVYTGRSEGVACQGEFKALLVKEKIQAEGLKINLEDSFAYADSLADFELLSLVGNPVAVHPDDELKKIALDRGWEILDGE